MRELALDHAEGRVGDDAYIAQVKDLRGRKAAFDGPRAGLVPAKRAAAWLQALGESLQSAHVPDAKTDLIHAIYERIVVAGPEFVRA